MAKKVRRVKKKKRSAPAAEVAAETSVEKPAESFEQEYAYVVKDLRRVLLVSGAMFVLLILLNLLIQI